MIKLNLMDANLIQIYGSHNGVTVNGMAHLVNITSCNKSWQYDLNLIAPPKLLKLKSSSKEASISTKDSLLSRIARECDRFH